MRNAFINHLTELAEVHTDIFLICGDIGYSVLEPFAQRFPERFLNVGIAEQNMMQVATGLSLEGYNVFAYSIGNFPTLRCMEQIRYDICYHKANVKIVAVGGGYAYGPLGASHHTTEDIAMLRAIPNMVVTAPGDPIEAEALAGWFARHAGPGYIRLNKSGEPRVHVNSISLVPGRLLEILSGSECAVLTCGAVLAQTLDEIRAQSLPWALYSAPFVSHLDPAALAELSERFETLITIEEHQLSGGFGSAVIETISDLYTSGRLSRMPFVQRIGIPDQFMSVSGTQEFLRKTSGISLLSLKNRKSGPHLALRALND